MLGDLIDESLYSSSNANAVYIKTTKTAGLPNPPKVIILPENLKSFIIHLFNPISAAALIYYTRQCCLPQTELVY